MVPLERTFKILSERPKLTVIILFFYFLIYHRNMRPPPHPRFAIFLAATNGIKGQKLSLEIPQFDIAKITLTLMHLYEIFTEHAGDREIVILQI